MMEGRKESGRSRNLFRRMAMQCLCSGEQAIRVDEVTPSNGEIELHANNGEIELRANNVGIQEAELSLQEGGSLHHEVGASSCYIKLLMTTDGTMGPSV
jgi:ATP-dependent RNA helicase DHX36